MFVNRCPCIVAQTVHNTMHICRYVACTMHAHYALSRAPRPSQPHTLLRHMQLCCKMGSSRLCLDRENSVMTGVLEKSITIEISLSQHKTSKSLSRQNSSVACLALYRAHWALACHDTSHKLGPITTPRLCRDTKLPNPIATLKYHSRQSTQGGLSRQTFLGTPPSACAQVLSRVRMSAYHARRACRGPNLVLMAGGIDGAHQGPGIV